MLFAPFVSGAIIAAKSRAVTYPTVQFRGATSSGIRGFLDFLVYRKRPDATDFRWGDGSAFDKIVPDAIPLALEFLHAPAYSLSPPAHDAEPSGGPWGPLTATSLPIRRPSPACLWCDSSTASG
jgi:hypothetical protein